MRPITRAISALLAAAAVTVTAHAATVGSYSYAPQYDYRDFYVTTAGKTFQVVLEGNPFPSTSQSDVARELLPQMQANKPRPPLTFTYDAAAEPQARAYRLYLVFDPASDLGADSVCATGKARHKEGSPGKVYVYAIYCRSDRALSRAIGWTNASGPADPAMGDLFKDLFVVIFAEFPKASDFAWP